MYYLVYGLFKLISFIPLKVLYLLANFVAFLLYHVIKYRKKTVLNNLLIAFPQKTEQERVKIAKRFYRNLADNILETFKLFSKGQAFINRHVIVEIDPLLAALKTNPSVQFLAGHQFNWEYINLAMKPLHPAPFIGVYMPLENKVFNKIFYNMRSQNGTIMIPAKKMKLHYEPYKNINHTLILVADQNPKNPDAGYWISFLNKVVPFIKNPELAAKEKNAAVVFGFVTKPKRGVYHVKFELITNNPNSLPPGEITKRFVAMLSRSIIAQPDIYLWSHRRWKFNYTDQFKDLLV